MASSDQPPRAEMGASLMCADQGDLRGAVRELDRAGIDYFHFDVMDGSFVPNFALSADTLRALRADSRRPFDAHLMVVDPERHLDRFLAAGADWISVHFEAARDPAGLLRAIRAAGRQAGLALSPATPASALAPHLADLDYVCVLTVEPGFAGQEFIPAVLPKIAELADRLAAAGSRARIQVDGNVSAARIPDLLARGASRFVGGTSAIFRPGAILKDEVAARRRLLDSCRR